MKHSFPRPKVIKLIEEPIGLVQGILPDSRNEWNVARALDSLHWDYAFQVPIGGGFLRGATIIDFVVYRALTYAVSVGWEGYWHNRKTETEDLLKEALARRFGMVPVRLKVEETNSYEAARRALLEKVGG